MITDSADMMSFCKSFHSFGAHTANAPLNAPLPPFVFQSAIWERPLPKDLNARVGPQGNLEM